ncbi:VanW family protein [Janibacter sp. GS2]|uniref:VanW family protein n=1 Tax=Janibacter sp. GS2 TaxID=3442646 RepID=UPI003EC08530
MAHDDTWMGDEEVTHRGRGRAILAGAFVVVVIAALYALAAIYFGDRVPADTHVSGVSLGGKSETEAREALEDGLAEEAAEPVVVVVEGKKHLIKPANAGLTYDYDASLEGLTGFSINPVDLYEQATGGIDREVEVAVDEDQLADAVDAKTASLDRKPVEGTVALEGAKVTQTASKPGLTVERDELTGMIADGWPQKHEFAAPTSTPAPELTQDTIDTFVEKDLEPLVSGPVKVTSTDPTAKGSDKDISFTLSAEQVAAAVTVKTTDGTLAADVDEKKLADTTSAAAKSSGLFRAAKEAGVVHRGGDSFDVTPSSSGLALDEKGIGAKVAQAMTKTGGKRVASVTSTEQKPDFTTAEAKKTLPKEQISTFTTYLPDNPVRTGNIKIAVRDLDGAYVAPGETFSLNQQLGERTPGKGYEKAGVISGGRLANDYGGGISQLSTTLFNAVFFSGARIEEFHPHSFYISRYPEGREATISWPNVDNRFTNDTGAGILISTSIKGDALTVSFRGRAAYDEIKATKSARKNVVPPKTITDDDKDCVAQSPAPGFSVDIGRKFIKDGRTVKSSDFTTTYIPQDDVTCTG